MLDHQQPAAKAPTPFCYSFLCVSFKMTSSCTHETYRVFQVGHYPIPEDGWEDSWIPLLQSCCDIGLVLYQSTRSGALFFDANHFNKLGGYGQGIKGNFLHRIRRKLEDCSGSRSSTPLVDDSVGYESHQDHIIEHVVKESDSWKSDCLSNLVVSYSSSEISRPRVPRRYFLSPSSTPADPKFAFLVHIAVLAAWVESKYMHSESVRDQMLEKDPTTSPSEIMAKVRHDAFIKEESVLLFVLGTQHRINQRRAAILTSAVRHATDGDAFSIEEWAQQQRAVAGSTSDAALFSRSDVLLSAEALRELLSQPLSLTDQVQLANLRNLASTLVNEITSHLGTLTPESTDMFIASSSESYHVPQCRSKKRKAETQIV